MSARRHLALSAFCVLAISAGLATAARADAPAVKDSRRWRPAWSSVPVAAIPATPSHDAAPERIPAGERVAGLSVIREEHQPAHRVRARVEGDTTSRQCLAADVDLSTSKDPMARGGAAQIDLRLAAVTAARAERLVVDGTGAATLEVVDAWVDPRSQGARTAARTTLPLARLAQGPEGAAVYGFRTDAGELWAVIATPQSPASAHSYEGETVFGGCGHMRVAVGPADGGGATAAVPLQLPAGARGAGSPAVAGELAIGATVSKLSRDAAPIITVTMAWTETPNAPPHHRPFFR